MMSNGVPPYRAPESPRRPRLPSSLSSSSWLTSEFSTSGDTNLERNTNSSKLTFLHKILNFMGIRRRQSENFKRKVVVSVFTSAIRRSDLSFLETDDFVDSVEFIGGGGRGEVYTTDIPSQSGKMFAIKKIMVRHSKEEHKKEASEIVTVCRHQNIMPLLAHVARPDCHFHIYKFMRNGSVEDAIRRASVGSSELDWRTRHKIAVGIATGLEYLHFEHEPTIIHRHLKPSNILLDDNMEAKITGFQLAAEEPNIGSTRIAGYMAPEGLPKNSMITIKCDIYNFGVVLAILVSGKFPADIFFQTGNYISYGEWLRNIVNSENPAAAIDSMLMGNGYDMQMLMVLRIACACTAYDPEERPSSMDVQRLLSQIQH